MPVVRCGVFGLRLGVAAAWAGMLACAAKPPGPEPAQVPTPASSAPSVMVSAVPAYRLIISPRLADAPSRLLALRTRVEAFDDTPLHFSPTDVRLELPDGSRAVVFDRARAVELVRRTSLAASDLTYLNGGQRHAPGGLSAVGRKQLRSRLVGGLLGEGALSRDEPLVGYLVVDTLRPFSSLEGALLEVVARDEAGEVLARESFYFIDSEPAPVNTGAGSADAGAGSVDAGAGSEER